MGTVRTHRLRIEVLLADSRQRVDALLPRSAFVVVVVRLRVRNLDRAPDIGAGFAVDPTVEHRHPVEQLRHVEPARCPLLLGQ